MINKLGILNPFRPYVSVFSFAFQALWGGLLLLIVPLKSSLYSQETVVSLVDIANNVAHIIKPTDSLPFHFDAVDHPDYDYLADSIITPGMNEKWGPKWKNEDTWTLARRLRIWAHDFLSKGDWGKGNSWKGNYSREIYLIPKILEHQSLGEDGLCSYYATFYMHVCLSMGINNRRVGWWQPGGDQLNEVYIPEIRKWVAISPLYNCWYSINGKPMSLVEINWHRHSGSLDLIKTERDFQSTYPDPEIRKNWLAHYAWDIYYWNKNGYLIMESPKAFRYENPEFWPYRNLEAEWIIRSTQKESEINFDASLIRLGIDMEESVVTLRILDYYVINLETFKYQVKDSDSSVILENNFGEVEEIDFNDFVEGNYSIEVFATNTRKGKSQTVKVEVTVMNQVKRE